MKIHVHNWVLNGSWKCIAPNHAHDEPDILDAATVWHILGVIKTHRLGGLSNITCYFTCECGEILSTWNGPLDYNKYYEHLDDAVFYWLRSIDDTI